MGQLPHLVLEGDPRERGVLVGGGRPTTQILLSPPLVADAADLKAGISTLDDAISTVF